MMGGILFPLSNVVADGQGKSLITTTISGVTTGIPASGWYINVHHGPTLATPDQAAQIYCGNISNPSPKPDHMQVLEIRLNLVFINQFTQVNKVASTVPGNGDVNPYGVAVVQRSVGNLKRGNILVSNFNNSANQQGTGSTIVQISPDGMQSVFAQLNASACPDGIGLTTALVIGPTGVGLRKDDILYVADTLNNRIIAIPNALFRQSMAHANLHVLTAGGNLNGELGLTIAPNDDILTVNGGDGNILEFTPAGNQVAMKLISNMGTPPGAGCLFGLALVPGGQGVYFVDDCTNQLNIFQ